MAKRLRKPEQVGQRIKIILKQGMWQSPPPNIPLRKETLYEDIICQGEVLESPWYDTCGRRRHAGDSYSMKGRSL